MNILALDTSMGACSATLLRHDGVLFARQERMTRGHAEALMPMVADVMSESGVALAALDRICATTGPGSFTGVRIAISAARGLALVTGAKLFGVDSLTAMAKQALATGIAGGAPFAVAVDARRGMLYFGLYDGAARKLDGPILVAPDDAANLLPGALRTAVGSGAATLAEAAASRGALIAARLLDLEPSATELAELARESGETVPVLRPLYLRAPDARPQAQAALAGR
ncbi:MAG: tRNA (adenosine(37)-N6)-threonylcarbamoyltransferase complex dimerization subunit type 1 TsaB [Methyloceanibacter sp.]|jgi:tRNA threonylcarbamoyl adenosine modification protein YeaZ|nr:tRNA (adenosine(37)-N6)-threonylcarbamoyltransferase complex dimerization subunit type 1 TsaB [Methyloceanibacter sp.]